MKNSPEPSLIWITRPQAQAERTAEQLRAQGHTPLIAPLLIEEALPFILPGEAIDGMILTSQNAAKYLAPYAAALVHLPIYCVGERTAQAAKEAGLPNAEALAQDAEGLIDALAARNLSGQHLFYAAADAPRHDLAAALAPHGMRISTATLYRMEPVASLPAAVIEQAANIRAVLLYSPFTAKTLASLLGAHHYPWQFLCLSDAVATELPHGADKAVASVPREDALLQLLAA